MSSAKRSKTYTHTDEYTDVKKITYDELIAEDPDFYKGSSRFDFPNGDQYEGEFCAHASGLIWRQGKGIYTTKDGHAYDGFWDGDKLIETTEVTITYLDGTKYIGPLRKSKYSGAGMYQLEEQVVLVSDFIDNKPSGEITLIDPNQKTWHGFAEKNESLLIPEHVFFNCVYKDMGKGKLKQNLSISRKQNSSGTLKSSRKSEDTKSILKYKNYRHIEKEVFMKSKKTPSMLKFEESEWYQEFLNFKDKYGSIYCKAVKKGNNSLTSKEIDWLNKYKFFEEKYQQLFQNYKEKGKQQIYEEKLFELIHAPHYEANNEPIIVFYPNESWNDSHQ